MLIAPGPASSGMPIGTTPICFAHLRLLAFRRCVAHAAHPAFSMKPGNQQQQNAAANV